MVLFLIIALVQLGVALYGTAQLRRHFNWYALLVLIVVFGLAYDNFVLAAGGILPEGPLLKALNAVRFWVHALFTPMMMIAAFGALRLTGSKFGQSRTWHTLVCILATLLILLGGYTDILNLQLEPVTANGVTRYVNTYELMPGPPIPALLTILVVLFFGGVLWRNTRWPWLFVSALIMFITAPLISSPVMQNIGEIVFAAGLVATMIFATRYAEKQRA